MWEISRLGTIRESTVRTERYIYRLVSNAQSGADGLRFGALPLKRIERCRLKEVQLALSRHYSVSTVNRAMSVIRAVLEYAQEERMTNWNPAKGLRSLKDTKKPSRETIHRALTMEETEAFFRTARARGSWYICLYAFLLNTGCRFGEAGALKFRDIQDGMIHIERTLTKTTDGKLIIGSDTKTGHSARSIPARREALTAIREQQRQNLKTFGDPDDQENVIFRAPRGGLLGARCVGKDIDLICAAAGIERFTAHAFRDTFATRAIESGMQAKTLQEILGHADIGITMNLYAHVMEDTMRMQMDEVKVMRTDQAL
jgi:Site-specific recombinase XerD